MSGRRIFLREVLDSFEARRMAQAMEDHGATVISVAYDGGNAGHGALAPRSKFIVVAALPGSLSNEAFQETMNEIDQKAFS